MPSDVIVEVCQVTGLMRGISAVTGEVVWKQRADGASKAVRSENTHTMNGQKIEVPTEDGGTMVVPYNPKFLVKHNELWPYVEEIANEVCRRIMEGETLKKITSTKGMPPMYIINRWRSSVPGFRQMMEDARKLRADMYHDELVEVVENVTEENAKSAKVKLDGYKHLAAVGDPDTYGSKTKISGDANAPLSFVFQTGIDRQALEENPPIEAEGGTVDESTQD